MAFECPRCLQFDFVPGDFGDRRQFAVEVVLHWLGPFRLPIAMSLQRLGQRGRGRPLERRGKGRWIIEEVDGGGEEQPTGDGGRKVQDAVGVARWVAEEHVAQHLFGNLGCPRIADEVGAVLALAEFAERHVVPARS